MKPAGHEKLHINLKNESVFPKPIYVTLKEKYSLKWISLCLAVCDMYNRNKGEISDG